MGDTTTSASFYTGSFLFRSRVCTTEVGCNEIASTLDSTPPDSRPLRRRTSPPWSCRPPTCPWWGGWGRRCPRGGCSRSRRRTPRSWGRRSWRSLGRWASQSYPPFRRGGRCWRRTRPRRRRSPRWSSTGCRTWRGLVKFKLVGKVWEVPPGFSYVYQLSRPTYLYSIRGFGRNKARQLLLKFWNPGPNQFKRVRLECITKPKRWFYLKST